MDTELDPEIDAQISSLSARGEAHFEAGEYALAREAFREAWALLPKPQNEWEASTWLAASLGDIDFLEGNYGSAREILEFAMRCPGGLGNPFLHLRLGQSLYELGEEDRAADELIRAYMGAGDDIFRDENPKYRAFLATRAKLD